MYFIDSNKKYLVNYDQNSLDKKVLQVYVFYT
jgi:hypothetical protein